MPGPSKRLSFTSWFTSALAAGALAGCQPELPPVTWRGEVVSLATSAPEDVCGGTLEWTDARALALQQTFGDATYTSVEYYLIPELWDDQTWCSAGAAACTRDNRVYAQDVPVEHELAHAIRQGRLPVVFEEGFAEMFGDLGWTYEPASRERLLEVLEAGDPVDSADYSRAGHFVAFLIETYGMPALDQLAFIGDLHDDYAKVRRDFETAFGVSLDQALDAYADYPECNPSAWMDRRIACDVPGVPLEPGIDVEVGLDIDLDCATEAIGPHGGFMFIEKTLDITPAVLDVPVWIYLTGDLSPDSSALLVSCDTTCADSTVKWLDDELPGEYIDLPPGRYVFRVFRPIDDPGTLGISMWQ